VMIRGRWRSSLFPYTTLFRSDVAFTGSCRSSICAGLYREDIVFENIIKRPVSGGRISSHYGWRVHPITHNHRIHTGIDYAVPIRSEEHTSELQSRFELVCRLL